MLFKVQFPRFCEAEKVRKLNETTPFDLNIDRIKKMIGDWKLIEKIVGILAGGGIELIGEMAKIMEWNNVELLRFYGEFMGLIGFPYWVFSKFDASGTEFSSIQADNTVKMLAVDTF